MQIATKSWTAFLNYLYAIRDQSYENAESLMREALDIERDNIIRYNAQAELAQQMITRILSEIR